MNLEGANLGGLGDGSPPEADDFSQLKGYLDVLWRDIVTSGILGGMAPLPSPLKYASDRGHPFQADLTPT